MRNCGKFDPENFQDSLRYGVYQGLVRVLKSMKPEDVIAEMKTSGLRGRGGAGFPTWLKWQITRAAQRTPKYIICNGDEGDPGAYMDRSVLEGDPHSVLEGLIIAAYAIGATRGYFYVRAEYPLAVSRVEKPSPTRGPPACWVITSSAQAFLSTPRFASAPAHSFA